MQAHIPRLKQVHQNHTGTLQTNSFDESSALSVSVLHKNNKVMNC